MRFYLMVLLIGVGLIMMTVSSVFAGERRATLSVPGMTCALCPATVEKALRNVQGVTDVVVTFADRKAVIRFEDSQTDEAALLSAVANSGYPAEIVF